jgi:TldD protein
MSQSLLDRRELERSAAISTLGEALRGADDGELFLEERQTETLVFDDGRLKSASFDQSEGFGMRAVAGETAAYAHASEVSLPALRRAAEVCAQVTRGASAQMSVAPARSNRQLYAATNPTEALAFSEKI